MFSIFAFLAFSLGLMYEMWCSKYVFTRCITPLYVMLFNVVKCFSNIVSLSEAAPPMCFLLLLVICISLFVCFDHTLTKVIWTYRPPWQLYIFVTQLKAYSILSLLQLYYSKSITRSISKILFIWSSINHRVGD